MKNVRFPGKLICLLKGNLKCINNYTTEDYTLYKYTIDIIEL